MSSDLDVSLNKFKPKIRRFFTINKVSLLISEMTPTSLGKWLFEKNPSRVSERFFPSKRNYVGLIILRGAFNKFVDVFLQAF